jgi:hypothetical protein
MEASNGDSTTRRLDPKAGDDSIRGCGGDSMKKTTVAMRPTLVDNARCRKRRRPENPVEESSSGGNELQ